MAMTCLNRKTVIDTRKSTGIRKKNLFPTLLDLEGMDLLSKDKRKSEIYNSVMQ